MTCNNAGRGSFLSHFPVPISGHIGARRDARPRQFLRFASPRDPLVDLLGLGFRREYSPNLPRSRTSPYGGDRQAAVEETGSEDPARDASAPEICARLPSSLRRSLFCESRSSERQSRGVQRPAWQA